MMKLVPKTCLCKTCKHYTPDDYGPDCGHPLFIGGYGPIPDEKKSAVDDRGIIYETDEGWGMIIGPNFGCIHHEEKPCSP